MGDTGSVDCGESFCSPVFAEQVLGADCQPLEEVRKQVLGIADLHPTPKTTVQQAVGMSDCQMGAQVLGIADGRSSPQAMGDKVLGVADRPNSLEEEVVEDMLGYADGQPTPNSQMRSKMADR